MAEAKPSPAPRHREAPTTCNVPSCTVEEDGEFVRGLCEVHWNTHRGLADPEPTEPKEFGQVDHPEVALP